MLNDTSILSQYFAKLPIIINMITYAHKNVYNQSEK